MVSVPSSQSTAYGNGLVIFLTMNFIPQHGTIIKLLSSEALKTSCSALAISVGLWGLTECGGSVAQWITELWLNSYLIRPSARFINRLRMQSMLIFLGTYRLARVIYNLRLQAEKAG